MQINWEEVKGWAGTHPVKSLVVHASTVSECIACINYAKSNGLTITPVGAGYSFGDMALNRDNILLNTSTMNKIICWDKSDGIMTVEPGLRISTILLTSLHDNWSLDSIPGALNITVAGAISSNVHGKDSWKKGNFGDRVIGLKLLISSGEMINVNRHRDKDLFRAIVGGMGLLGVIVEITLQLTKIISPYVECNRTSTKSIRHTLEILEESADNSDFMIAWVDGLSKGSTLGRGYVISANFVDDPQVVDQERLIRSLTMSNRLFGLLPSEPTWKVLRLFNVFLAFKALNTLIYYSVLFKIFSKQRNECRLLPEYLFPHSSVPDLNHLMRPHGFVEVQFLFERSDALPAIERCLNLCHDSNITLRFCAIKKHKGDDYLISFSGDGYTFNIDILLKSGQNREIFQFLDKLFDIGREFSAKIYLAKDEYLPKDLFRQIYPRYQQFLTTKKTYDQDNVFSSGLFRRLIKEN